MGHPAATWDPRLWPNNLLEATCLASTCCCCLRVLSLICIFSELKITAISNYVYWKNLNLSNKLCFQVYKFIPPNVYFNMNDPRQISQSKLLESCGDIVYHTHHAAFAVFLLLGPAFRKLMFGCCYRSDLSGRYLVPTMDT